MPDDVLELVLSFQPIPTDRDDPWPAGFSVRCPQLSLSWDGGQFTNPLDDKALGSIRWYLEEYPDWPYDVYRSRAHEIEADLEVWGRALFKATFGETEPARIYEKFLNQPARQRRLIVEAQSPQVQRLPWELLAESSGPLFSRRVPISIYRRVHLEHVPEVHTFELPLRVLLITSRPEGAGFIDPRSVARGMLDALTPLVADGRVAVDFLRPPTLAALDAALRAGERAGRPYHLVHFDGHGVYHKQSGLGQLVFEHDDASEDMVDAQRLGTILQECGVPLMVLNACQSAQGDQTNPFSSVATRLIEAGIGGVLSMSHSVLVVTAGRFVRAFYEALVQGDTVSRATDEARRALVHDPRRHQLAEQGDGQPGFLELKDWFLPVLYQQREDAAPFAGSAPTAPGAAPSRLHGLPPEPLHGFVGRARELLAIERLFRGHGVVVLHGWGGVGKTALSAEAARWFTRTGLVLDAAFVSFEHCHSAEYALAEVGRGLVEPNFNAGAAAGDPVERIAAALAARPALVIFDNFETALGEQALLGPDDLRAVLAAARAWAQVPGSRVLITSRDTTFGDAAFAPGKLAAHLELAGLATPDALLLAAEIMKNNGIDRERVPRQALERLLAQLGAHPLSLELVLPRLRERTADQLVDEFGALLAEFRRERGETRNDSLLVSLDFSLRRLSPAARERLPDLAVFQGGGLEHAIVDVTGMGWPAWTAIRAELVAAALASVDGDIGVNVRDPDNPAASHASHPVRFHPTLLPYLGDQLAAGRRAELEARYRQAYHDLASFLYQTDDRTPVQARAIAARELPNLRRALDLIVAAGDFEAAADLADSICKFLDAFGRWRERDQVLGQVRHLSSADTRGTEALTFADWQIMVRREQTLLGQGRLAEAERLCRDILACIDLGTAFEAAFERCIVLIDLARCLSGQGRPSNASEVYRDVLSVLTGLEQTDAVRQKAGLVHTDLAGVLTNLGRYAEARQEYEAALEIDRALGDERGASVDLGQLGALALAQGDLPEARRRYLEMLAAFRRLGEDRSEAIAWHQLGVVAQEARDWEEAERCYKESLALKERLGDKALAAGTCNQLAIVAQLAGRPAEAERWVRRAIQLDEEVGNPKEYAIDYSNLAVLLLDQGRLDEAEHYAQRAREIKDTLDLSAEPWKIYNILARIAERRGRPDEARAWRQKAEEVVRAFEAQSGGQWSRDGAAIAKQLQQWQPVIAGVVAACQGSSRAAAELSPFLDRMAGRPDWAQLIPALRRILAGERDEAALTGGLDRIDAAIVRKVLEELVGLAGGGTTEADDADEGTEGTDGGPGGQQGVTLEQLLGLVARALSGDHALGAQLFPAVQHMAADPAAPPALRALGRVLQRLLAGDRSPDLSALPPELAAAVRAMLAGGGATERMTAEPGEGTERPGGRPAGPTTAAERVRRQWGSVVAAAVAACRGNDRAAGDLAPCLDELAGQEGSRALAAALRRLLAGERDPAALLAGLDGPGTYLVGEVLAGLAGGGAPR